MLGMTEGTPALTTSRKDAWRGLGTSVPPKFTAEQVLRHGKLGDWKIRKAPVFTRIEHTDIAIPERFAVVRDSPHYKGQYDVIGRDVGPEYTVMQNEYMVGMLDRVVEDADGQFSATGELDGGRKVFVTMQLPGMAKVGGSDLVDTYLAAMTSHDGRQATTFMVTPVHRGSLGMLNINLPGADNAIRVKHTQGANRTVAQQVKEALEFTYNYLDVFEAEAAKLVAVKLSQGAFEKLITEHFGAPRNAPAPTVTRTQNKLDLMARLFANKHEEPTGNTAWAGLTALVEWFDHHSHVRPDGGSESFARARRAVFETSFKNDAYKVMRGLVK